MSGGILLFIFGAWVLAQLFRGGLVTKLAGSS
jgi:hypothetical protein